MSFQQSAQSWRAKAHISDIKPPVLIGICALMLCALFFMLSGLWSAVSNEGFSIDAGKAPAEVADDKDSSLDKGSAGGEALVFVVHVGGAVVSPGVYEFEEGSRVHNAIERAGGFAESAARDSINLARTLTDGEQIIIPTIEESEQISAPDDTAPQAGRKININSASAAELTTLSGIGEATAHKIIADREKNGPFSSPEELMRVSGIGEKKYAQLADSICI